MIEAVLETNILPPIPIAWDGAGEDTSATALMRLIQPTIRGTLPVVGPVTLAPWGEAQQGTGTVVFFILLALLIFGAVKLVTGR